MLFYFFPACASCAFLSEFVEQFERLPLGWRCRGGVWRPKCSLVECWWGRQDGRMVPTVLRSISKLLLPWLSNRVRASIICNPSIDMFAVESVSSFKLFGWIFCPSFAFIFLFVFLFFFFCWVSMVVGIFWLLCFFLIFCPRVVFALWG